MPDNVAIGDAQPEDAWDHDDPVPDQVHNLCERLCAVGGPLPDERDRPIRTVLEEILEHAGAVLNRRGESKEVRHRAELILEDGKFVLSRLGGD